MRTPTTRRLLALFAAVWTGAYLGIYLDHRQTLGLEPSAWYLGLVLVCGGLLLAVAAGPRRSWALGAALAALVLTMAIELPSVGWWLAPALLLALVALVVAPSAP